MKKRNWKQAQCTNVVTFILTFFLVFSLASCGIENDFITLSNAKKPSPSTVLSVKIPRRSSQQESVTIKLRVGKSEHAQYQDLNYRETILSIDAPGVLINGYNDCYLQTFDITEEKYECKKYTPQYAIEIPLSFGGCEQTSGTITISLVSYFDRGENGETDGENFYINYIIKAGVVCFFAK